MKAKLFLAVAAIVATSCQNAAEQEAGKYEIVAKGSDSDAKCEQSRRVADAYLSQQDEASYTKWKLRSDLDCSGADLDRRQRQL